MPALMVSLFYIRGRRRKRFIQEVYMSVILEVNGLTKEYKELRAVDDLSFQLSENEILGLLGPNGSGKSTTMNCILSLLKYNSGSIQIFGKEMSPSAYDIKKDIGVIFQDVAVFQELTVYKNIDYFCGLYIRDKKQRKQYIEEAIELTGLEDYKKFYPKQLSGGLLRRLNIACGIAHKPKLLFFDEPTVAVDPQSRNNILEGIEKLRDNGASVIYTTHYMEEVEQICDRIIIMDKGKIIAGGTSDSLKELTKVKEKIIVEVAKLSESKLDKLKESQKDIDIVYQHGMLTFTYKDGRDHITALIDRLRDTGIRYTRIYSERPTLNDVFLELTGKELRD